VGGDHNFLCTNSRAGSLARVASNARVAAAPVYVEHTAVALTDRLVCQGKLQNRNKGLRQCHDKLVSGRLPVAEEVANKLKNDLYNLDDVTCYPHSGS
jgi:hypothetical protein